MGVQVIEVPPQPKEQKNPVKKLKLLGLGIRERLARMTMRSVAKDLYTLGEEFYEGER